MGKKRTKAGASKAEAAAKRDLFVKAFVANGGNATQAAIAAGYSAKTAKQAGSRMLTHVDVKGDIEECRKVASEKAALTVERTLQEVARLAYFDPRKLRDEKGNLKPWHELDDDTAAVIAAVEEDEIIVEGSVIGKTKRIKCWDKNAALEKAMKHLGLYEVDNRQKAPPTVNLHAVTVNIDFDKVTQRAREALLPAR